jgi:hypothetical protein
VFVIIAIFVFADLCVVWWKREEAWRIILKVFKKGEG